MIDILVKVLLITGFTFCLIAAIGLIRFQDTLTRIHAATKAGAFGGTLVAIALGMHFNDMASWVQTLLFIIFFYATAPVAANMIGHQSWRADENSATPSPSAEDPRKQD
jgi:multicomponent Na+:H+ antiporter subunit G